MTTLIFNDKEIIIDNSLLDGIPFFESIQKHIFKESIDNKINIKCNSKAFMLMLNYRMIFDEDTNIYENEMLELCDYYCMDDIKDKYLNNQTYLRKKYFDDKRNYIINFIKEKNAKIYFDDKIHFDKFFDSPTNTEYHECMTKNNINILFFLTYQNYDLMRFAIDNKLFDKININQDIFHKGKKYNLLTFSCLHGHITSDKIIEILLEHMKSNFYDLLDLLYNNRNLLSYNTIKLIQYKLSYSGPFIIRLLDNEYYKLDDLYLVNKLLNNCILRNVNIDIYDNIYNSEKTILGNAFKYLEKIIDGIPSHYCIEEMREIKNIIIRLLNYPDIVINEYDTLKVLASYEETSIMNIDYPRYEELNYFDRTIEHIFNELIDNPNIDIENQPDIINGILEEFLKNESLCNKKFIFRMAKKYLEYVDRYDYIIDNSEIEDYEHKIDILELNYKIIE
jgi:hypothetical protein